MTAPVFKLLPSTLANYRKVCYALEEGPASTPNEVASVRLGSYHRQHPVAIETHIPSHHTTPPQHAISNHSDAIPTVDPHAVPCCTSPLAEGGDRPNGRG